MDKLTAVIAQLTSLAMSLIVLGVALGIVFGSGTPFVGEFSTIFLDLSILSVMQV